MYVWGEVCKNVYQNISDIMVNLIFSFSPLCTLPKYFKKMFYIRKGNKPISI